MLSLRLVKFGGGDPGQVSLPRGARGCSSTLTWAGSLAAAEDEMANNEAILAVWTEHGVLDDTEYATGDMCVVQLLEPDLGDPAEEMADEHKELFLDLTQAPRTRSRDAAFCWENIIILTPGSFFRRAPCLMLSGPTLRRASSARSAVLLLRDLESSRLMPVLVLLCFFVAAGFLGSGDPLSRRYNCPSASRVSLLDCSESCVRDR